MQSQHPVSFQQHASGEVPHGFLGAWEGAGRSPQVHQGSSLLPVASWYNDFLFLLPAPPAHSSAGGDPHVAKPWSPWRLAHSWTHSAKGQ